MKSKSVLAAVIAAPLLTLSFATPALAQDQDRGAVVFHEDSCSAAIFRLGEAPIFLDYGDAYHEVDNSASTTSIGNLIYSCKGEAEDWQVPDKTISVAQMCGVFLIGPSGFTIIEGRGKAVLNKAGNFMYRCVVAGNAIEEEITFIEAP